ncbi:MAG: DUF456 family protein [Fidelibacterota bacterium]
MTIFLTIIYWILLLTAVVSIIFSLPGTFLIVLFHFLFQLVDSAPGIDWRIIGILLGISIALELAEFIITAWSSWHYGASRAGMVGAVIGSIVGAVLGTGIVPLFGSLLGAFGGAFCGAYLVDFLRTGDQSGALHSGIGAFTGTAGGKLLKIFGAVAMLVMIAR